jgi:hypothetical protein
MMKKIFLTLTFISTLFAQDWAGHSGGFLRMGMTSRSTAMGGGLTADLDHSFAVFHNPAWAAFLVNQQVGFSYTKLSFDRRLSATSFATPLPPTAGIGVAWINSGVTDIQGRYSSGEKSTVMQSGENAVMITFAQRILPWLSVGSTVKILRYDLPITESDQLSGKGIGFDVGILIKSGEFVTLGIMIQDISSNYQWNTGDVYAEGRVYKDEFPTLYRIGSRMNYKGLIIVGDAGIVTDHKSFTSFLPRLGVEYAFLDQYYFRGGYGNNRIAFGVGLEYGLFKAHDSHLDYAFSMDWVNQTGHIISYAFNF